MGKTVAIVGYGFVGRAMHKLFPDAYIFDEPLRIGRREGVNEADVAFLCVPTNGLPDGTLDMSIVEEVVSWVRCPLIIIRSTLNPGTCDYLEEKYGRNIVMVPEYVGMTTNHPLVNERERPFLIIGGRLENRRKAIEVFHSVYNAGIKIRQVSNRAAEVVKLSENRNIGWVVMQAHELFETCEAAGLDFYELREALFSDDPRFNAYFTFPYPGNLGFQSSHCLSKDIPAFCAWARSVGYEPVCTEKLVEKSREYAARRGRPSE